METDEMQKLRYPVGNFNAPENYSDEMITGFIKDIEDGPVNLRKAVKGLTEEQLDTPYRPRGWTVRQVIHHLPDSHMNAYIRIKLALTEVNPVVKTYEEQLWAELPDNAKTPVSVSLDLFDNLTKRWVILIRSLSIEDLDKCYTHPQWGLKSLKWVLAQYAWHSRHHVAHITSLRLRNGW